LHHGVLSGSHPACFRIYLFNFVLDFGIFAFIILYIEFYNLQVIFGFLRRYWCFL
jgi:hypothetical protein